VAESNRRGEDAADDNLDEVLDDAVDDDTEGDDDDRPVSRGGTATRSRTKAESADSKPRAKKDTDRVGIFARIIRFVREVIAELRKTIWPTRKELLTYTAVVVTFVTVMMSLVAGLDFGFAKGVLFVFGNA
jgi:preprotein translocase subunit SecE